MYIHSVIYFALVSYRQGTAGKLMIKDTKELCPSYWA